MKKYIKSLSLSLMLMFSASAMAQNQTVTGTVLDELGEPGRRLLLADALHPEKTEPG